MGVAITVIFFVVLVFAVGLIAAANSPEGKYSKLVLRGIRARGLVLAADQLAMPVPSGIRKFESRTVTLDVEVPGQAPYEISLTLYIPKGLVEALPGSSLELAVDPKDPAKIAVVGPGGFTGPWLLTAQQIVMNMNAMPRY